jgi:cytochrome c-type protein NapC
MSSSPTSPTVGLIEMHPVMSGLATGCAVLAMAILLWFLLRRPPLDFGTKVLLMFGLGVLPITAALLGNVVSLMHSTHRDFCGSCHVMKPYTEDSSNLSSATLAAQHGRNQSFGDENCYTCHQDYVVFGAVLTKLSAMRDVWSYYTEYRYYTVEQALAKLYLFQPFPNKACISCHSTRIPRWNQIRDHQGLLEAVRQGEVSCVSQGCHGPVHPFSKRPQPGSAR